MLHVEPVLAFRDNVIWLLRDDAVAGVTVVDPGDADPVIARLAELDQPLTDILITHHHADHVGGILRLLRQWPDARVHGPANERIPACTNAVADGDRVTLDCLGLELRVLAIPGHTAGHIAYFGHGRLFCGDTLFAGGCGRIFEGTPRQMYESLSRLAALPADTLVYCAHEYTEANLRFALQVEPDNTALQARYQSVRRLRAERKPSLPSLLDDERATNPFLRAGTPSVRTAAEQHAGRTLPTAVEVFASVRSWKDRA